MTNAQQCSGTGTLLLALWQQLNRQLIVISWSNNYYDDSISVCSKQQTTSVCLSVYFVNSDCVKLKLSSYRLSLLMESRLRNWDLPVWVSLLLADTKILLCINLDPAKIKKSTLLNNLFDSKLCVTVFKDKNAIRNIYILFLLAM